MAKLEELSELVIDFGEKGSEAQLWQMVSGSKKWRRMIFNEVVKWVGSEFLLHVAHHVRTYECRLEEFEFPLGNRKWLLPEVDAEGIVSLLKASPGLTTFEVCSDLFDGVCLLKVAKLCPKMKNVVVDDSLVQDKDVVRFFKKVVRSRDALFYGMQSSIFVHVRRSKCSKDLAKKIIEMFGKELKVAV